MIFQIISLIAAMIAIIDKYPIVVKELKKRTNKGFDSSFCNLSEIRTLNLKRH